MSSSRQRFSLPLPRAFEALACADSCYKCVSQSAFHFHTVALTKFFISIDTARVRAARILSRSRVKHWSHSSSQVTHVIPPVSPLIRIPRRISLGGLFKRICTSANSSNHLISVRFSKLCLI